MAYQHAQPHTNLRSSFPHSTPLSSGAEDGDTLQQSGSLDLALQHQQEQPALLAQNDSARDQSEHQHVRVQCWGAGLAGELLCLVLLQTTMPLLMKQHCHALVVVVDALADNDGASQTIECRYNCAHRVCVYVHGHPTATLQWAGNVLLTPGVVHFRRYWQVGTHVLLVLTTLTMASSL